MPTHYPRSEPTYYPGQRPRYYPGYRPNYTSERTLIYTPQFRPKPPGRPPHVPRLKLEDTHRPHNPDAKQRRTFRDRDGYHRVGKQHPRQAALHRDWNRRPREDRLYPRKEALHTRDTVYGYDRDYLQDYYLPALGDVDAARVQLRTHDSSDPFSCTCYPRASQKTIPSMTYDLVRCPHPMHKFQPAKEDVFTYPWTTQTFRPTVGLQRGYGYKEGQVLPPSAVTGPPFVLYNRKVKNPKRAQKTPPYSAPEETLPTPLLAPEPTDRRLRRVNRKRLQALPRLPTVEEDLTPYDSLSQRAPLSFFRSPSLRLRTVDTHVLDRVNTELRATTSRMPELSTPRDYSVLDSDGFPETPNRIFKGEYVDSSGQKYEYDIRYGKTTLEGKRTRLQTI